MDTIKIYWLAFKYWLLDCEPWQDAFEIATIIVTKWDRR